MEYYFGEHLRWNLGWDTPNQAGAFLATLLPWLWALVALAWRRRHGDSGPVRAVGRLLLLGGGFAAETAVSYALAHTYSRGALVGLAAGALAWMALVWFRRRARGGDGLQTIWTPWLARAVLWTVCLAVTGFHSRLTPDHLAEDRSSLNRLLLWRGGAELIAASPVHGWGWDQSGAAFMDWTQPVERKEGYLSMVNSYLTVAVETGLPIFALLLAVLLAPLARPTVGLSTGGFRHRTFDSPLVHAATASWATWLACMAFSNLWIFPRLWITPGIGAILLLVLPAHAFRLWRSTLLRGIAPAIAVTLILWLAGIGFATGQPLRITRVAPGIVDLERSGPLPASATGSTDAKAVPSIIAVVSDVAVFGESPGQELRRWLLADSRLHGLRVFAKPELLTSTQQLADASALLLCGESARAVAEPTVTSAKLPVWLLHPTIAPPSKPPTGLPAGSRVILPGIDITGEAAGWWTWAAEASPPLPVEQSYGLAVDVRPRWPALAIAWSR